MLSIIPLSGIPINERTTYWLDLCDEKLRFRNVDPRGLDYRQDVVLALEILIEEAGERGLRSYGMREILKRWLHTLTKTHPIIRGTTAALALRDIANDLNGNPSLVLLAKARDAINEVTSNVFVANLFERLYAMLDREEPFSEADLADLNVLTADIVSRFLRAGYGVRGIFQLLINVFSSFQLTNGIANTRFPFGYLKIDASQFADANGEVDGAKLQSEVTRRLEGLSIRDRIDALHYYLTIPPENKQYIFGIEGLHGTSEFRIGKVRFYSPVTSPIIAQDAHKMELIKQDPDRFPINATVTVKSVDEEQGRAQARSEVESALDYVRSVKSSPVPLSIRSDRQIIVNPRFGLFGYVESRRDAPEVIGLATIDTGTVSQNITSGPLADALSASQNHLEMTHQLELAMRWYRKGQDAMRPEDRFLFHWLCLEKLFSRSPGSLEALGNVQKVHERIAHMFPYVLLTIYAGTLSRNVLSYMWTLSIGAIYTGAPLRLTSDNVLSFFTDDGKSLTEEQLLAKLSSMAAQIPSKCWSDAVNRIAVCFQDSQVAYAYLSHLLDEWEEEIRIIYWLRNRLVHGANFEFSTLDYFEHLLNTAAFTLLRLVLNPKNRPSDAQRPLDTLVATYVNGRRMMNDLAQGVSSLPNAIKTYARFELGLDSVIPTY
jgi:hypothetical protein